MTMICEAKNKAELKDKLESGCLIIDPTPFGQNGFHSIRDVNPGFKQPVVLDPQTRRRFAVIEKLTDGSWKVK